ncbi:hypothetical protein LTR66_015902, partial [Elasticomyces elasticus]
MENGDLQYIIAFTLMAIIGAGGLGVVIWGLVVWNRRMRLHRAGSVEQQHEVQLGQ